MARRHLKSYGVALVLGTLAVAAGGCRGDEAEETPPATTIEQRLKSAAAGSSFDVSKAAPAPVLAVEVRVTPTSATAVQARFVRTGLQQASGEREIELTALAAGAPIHRQTMSDPLRMEEEIADGGKHRTVRLTEQTVWVYLPTATETVEFAPLDPTLQTVRTTLDLRPTVQALCASFPSIDQCASELVGR